MRSLLTNNVIDHISILRTESQNNYNVGKTVYTELNNLATELRQKHDIEIMINNKKIF